MSSEYLKGIVGSLGDELRGKRVALCVTASVSCYRAPEIARLLMRYGAEVIPVMTKRASELLNPAILLWATGNEVITEITGRIEHIELTESERRVDAVVIAPATGNTIAKIRSGVSENPVTLLASCALGAGIPVIIAPAMHKSLLDNPFIKDSVEELKARGVTFIGPIIEEGKAKLPEPGLIAETVINALTAKTLRGRRFIVTAGPTREYIDDVRFFTNASSGRMGLEIAKHLLRMGAYVTLIKGPTHLDSVPGIEAHEVIDSKQMLEEALKAAKGSEAIFAAAAVSDYTPVNRASGKIDSRSNEEITVTLKRTSKLLREVKRENPKLEIVAFRALYGGVVDPAAEYSKMAEEIDPLLLVINDVSRKDIGFASEFNEAVIVGRSGRIIKTGRIPKSRMAKIVIDEYLREKERMG